jgi:hypothetical protein
MAGPITDVAEADDSAKVTDRLLRRLFEVIQMVGGDP